MPVIDTFCCSCTFFAKNNNKSEKFFLLIYVYLLYKGENVIKLIGRPSIFVTPAPNTTKSNGRQQQQGAVNIQCAGKKDGNKTRDRKSNQNRIPNLEYDRLKKIFNSNALPLLLPAPLLLHLLLLLPLLRQPLWGDIGGQMQKIGTEDFVNL